MISQKDNDFLEKEIDTMKKESNYAMNLITVTNGK